MATFKNVWYDSWNNKMHLWECENGKTEHKIFDHDIEYYVKDSTGNSQIKDIYGTPVTKRIVKNLEELKTIRETGEKLFESDLSEEVKFLHKRYGDQDDKINFDDYVIANIDIEIQTEGEFPKPEEARYPINLITVQFMRTNEIYTFGLNPYTGNEKGFEYFTCKSEEDLIEKFCKLLKYKKCDCITGWNSSGESGGFDIPYLFNRIKRLDLKCSLSPVNRMKQKFNGNIEIVGVADLDLMKLFRKFVTQNYPSYSLNAIGIEVCGEGKLEFEGSLNELYRVDWNKFVEYNVQDVLLVSKIEKKKKLIELAINLSNKTRTPFNKITSSVAFIEGYIIRYLHRENLVMSDRKNGITGSIEGGYVESHPGFYFNVMSIDGTSLYPSIIRQFNISPETKVLNPISEEGLIKTTIPGLYYKKDIQGIVPKVITELFNTRKDLKSLMQKYELEENEELTEFYDSQQNIFKTIGNSLYGCLLETSFHFYDLDNGSCVTSNGRTAINYIADCVRKYLSETFPKIAKKYYPNYQENFKKVKNIVSVIDTDSLVGHSIIETNIGKISLEDIFNSHSNNIQEKSKDNFIANVQNLSSLSFNKISEKIEFGNILYIKKHKVQKRLYKIKHENDEIIVTEDHSIIVKRENHYLDISPKDLKNSDKIIKINSLSFSNFTIEDLGIQEEWVYDIEVENNHNFFANNILVHNSNYIVLDDIYKNSNCDKSFLDFSLDFEENILNPFLKKCMNIFAEKYNTEPILHFKREKIILKHYVQAKKKYITYVIANEKKIYDEPQIKITGVEIVKSDTCKFSRKSLKELALMMFDEDKPNKENMINHIRKSFDEFKKQSIGDISTPKSVQDYDKYFVGLDNTSFKKATPIHNRASIIYNYIIKSKSLPYVEITNGSKMKYIYVKENNIYKTNVVGYVGNWPEVFNKIFEIDYDTQFEKQYMNIAQRFFDTLGFGLVTLKESKLMKMFEDDD